MLCDTCGLTRDLPHLQRDQGQGQAAAGGGTVQQSVHLARAAVGPGRMRQPRHRTSAGRHVDVRTRVPRLLRLPRSEHNQGTAPFPPRRFSEWEIHAAGVGLTQVGSLCAHRMKTREARRPWWKCMSRACGPSCSSSSPFSRVRASGRGEGGRCPSSRTTTARTESPAGSEDLRPPARANRTLVVLLS